MNKVIKIAVAVLFSATVFAFFAFFYPFHLRYLEQFQLFQFTWEYLAKCISVPGGAVRWLSEFFIQFFLFPVAGAAIITGLLYLLAFLVRKVSARNDILWYSLSYLPSVVMSLFLCDGNLNGVTIRGPLAIVLCLLFVLLLRKLSSGTLSDVVSLALVPIVYYLVGPLALVYALLVCRDCGWWKRVASLTLLIAACAFSYLFILSDFKLIFAGYGYQFVDSSFPFATWIPAALVLVLCLCSSFFRDYGAWCGIAVSALVVIALPLLLLRFADMPKENVMRCDWYLRTENWQGLIDNAQKHTPECFEEVSSLFLALAQQGRLSSDMFNYPNAGSPSMIPPFLPKSIYPTYAAEVLYRLGCFSPAQRQTFEALVSGFSSGGNVRCVKRLAELNAVQGNMAVARKYLDELSHTFFYSRWAREFDLSNPEYQKLMGMSYVNAQFFVGDFGYPEELARLVAERPDNGIAREYMLCMFLADKNIDGFAKYFDPSLYEVVPKAYQEAYTLLWMQTHDNFDSIPECFDKGICSGLMDFAAARSGGKSMEYMRKKFGNTYWYHLFYRKMQ